MAIPRWLRAWAMVCVFALGAPMASAGEAALGGKDFYPSDDRPIGFRGDGNGAFPGATPVTEWREGDVEQKKVPHTVYNSGSPVPRTEQRLVWTFTSDKLDPATGLLTGARNIVWKTEMPDFSNSSPVVVGDRVFCMAEPWTLVCVDAHKGQILWQRDANPLEAIGLPADEVRRVTEIMELVNALHAIKGNLTGNYGRLPAFYRPEYRQPWTAQVQVARRLAERAAKLNAEGADKLLQTVAEILKGIDSLPVKPAAAPVGKKPGVEEIVAGDGQPVPPGADTPQQPDATLYGNLARKIAGLHLLIESPLRKKYGLYVADHWAGMVGMTFATPVSDGRRVYVSVGHGQVACFDLEGKCLWARHVPVKTRWFDFVRLGNTPSPLLAGNVLIAQQTEALVGFDKRTGETIWQRPDIVVAKSYNVATHKLLPLAGGGKARDVLVTSHGKVLDPANGRDLVDLQHEGVHIANETTPPVVGGGDVACLYVGGSYSSYRLTTSPDGAVQARRIATFEQKWNHGTGLIFTDGRLVAAFGRGDGIYDTDGNCVGPFRVSSGAAFRGVGPILAGKCVVGIGDAGYDYGRIRDDEQILVDCPVIDLTDAKAPKTTVGRNFLGGLNKARLRYLEKHARELYVEGWFGPLAVRRNHGTWGMEAIPSQFGYASPAASGNRLFIRSVSHLYCIGDPAVPYDWNPASRR